MLYRSGYALKHNQEAILKIKITHEGFIEILKPSVETSYNPAIYASDHAWALALSKSEVRHQWDPDRAITGEKLDRRAIQIGISGNVVGYYVNKWIVGLEEVTDLARRIGEAVKQKKRDLPEVPKEEEYVVSAELQRTLGITQ